MLRAFYVSIHEVNALPDALEAIARLDEEFRSKAGVRVGLLANWLRWRRLIGFLAYAERLGIPVMVDNGGFQGQVDPLELARWACTHASLYDHILAPDYPVALCLTDGAIDPSCASRAAEKTIEMHKVFYRVLERCGAAEKALPVLQGWDAESYARMYEKLAEEGIDTSYVALGSAKLWQRLSRDRARRGKLRNLLEELAARLRGARLHALGIHGLDLHGIYYHDIVYSADSGSQGLNYRFKWRTVLGCRSFTRDCYIRAIEYEVRLSLKPLLNVRLTHAISQSSSHPRTV